jgi:hypothetical protein
MSAKITKISTFSQDDYGPIGVGISGDIGYSVTLNKSDSNSYEINELGPCMNPNGYVSNKDCPDNDPYCNCPKDLTPNQEEVSSSDLMILKQNTNECYHIKDKLSVRWFGIDYSNPSCSYNCIEEKYINIKHGSTSGLTGIQKLPGYLMPTRKAFGQGVSAGNTGTLWNVPGDVVGQTFDEPCGVPGVSGGVSGGFTGTVGPNFKHYLEYSKTNATFWNTPKETPLYRKAQTALLTYQRIKIVVNGDFDIKPGNLISIVIQTPEMSNISKARFSGRWMIYKNEHVITSQKHSMILYLMRDGNYHNPETATEVDTTIEVSGVVGAYGRGGGE